MAAPHLGPSWITRRFLLLTGFCALGAAGIAWATLAFGTTREFELFGPSMASRTLNQLTAVVLTCMALILPLTANLYSPKLVKVYVTHPLTVAGLSVLVLSQLVVMATSFFPRDHVLAPHLVHAVSFCYLAVITATLPFLYGLSQFLRPSYFLPLLTRRGVADLALLNRGRGDGETTNHLFETVDVLTNIAVSGMARGDRHVVLLALGSLHTLLMEIVTKGQGRAADWRARNQCFVPGLAQEGQAFLTREGVWPEAYVLAQILKVMEVATRRHHEILAELASHLVDSARLAQALGREHVVELHVMAFNTLLRYAIEEKDLRRFQNFSYYFRVLAESFVSQPDRLRSTTHHLIHYGQLAARQGLLFGEETVLYDLGELLLAVSRQDEDQACRLLREQAHPYFESALAPGEPSAKVAGRTLTRLLWEARAGGLNLLADAVESGFLSDHGRHQEEIRRVLGENRELHYEFNDRLMRFAYLSPGAEGLARAFLGPA